MTFEEQMTALREQDRAWFEEHGPEQERLRSAIGRYAGAGHRMNVEQLERYAGMAEEELGGS